MPKITHGIFLNSLLIYATLLCFLTITNSYSFCELLKGDPSNIFALTTKKKTKKQKI